MAVDIFYPQLGYDETIVELEKQQHYGLCKILLEIIAMNWTFQFTTWYQSTTKQNTIWKVPAGIRYFQTDFLKTFLLHHV